jgi:hypothetical protein
MEKKVWFVIINHDLTSETELELFSNREDAMKKYDEELADYMKEAKNSLGHFDEDPEFYWTKCHNNDSKMAWFHADALSNVGMDTHLEVGFQLVDFK